MKGFGILTIKTCTKIPYVLNLSNMRQIIAVALVLCLVAAATSQNPQGGFAPAAGHAFLDSENVGFHHDSTDEDDKVREKRQFGFGGGYGGGRGGGYGGRGGFGGGRGFGGGGYGGRGGFGGGGFGGGGGGYGR